MEDEYASNQFTLWSLIFTGHNLQSLQRVTARTPIGRSRTFPEGIVSHLEVLKKDLELYRLRDTEEGVRDELEQLISHISHMEGARVLGATPAKAIRTVATTLHTALQDEALNRTLFLVQPSNLGDMQEFLQNPRCFIGLQLDEPLPCNEQAQRDLQEAANSFAAGFYLASMNVPCSCHGRHHYHLLPASDRFAAFQGKV